MLSILNVGMDALVGEHLTWKQHLLWLKTGKLKSQRDGAERQIIRRKMEVTLSWEVMV